MYKPKGYWTKERVFEEARKYHSKVEFRNGCPVAYRKAIKNEWIDEMTWLKRPVVYNKKWTKEEVFKKAREYQTRNEFLKGCSGAYEAAWRNGWLDEMDCFKKRATHNKKWTKEEAFKEARNYETRSEFQKGNPTAYNLARKHGWLDEMTWFVDGRVKKFTNKNDSVYKYYWEETNAIYIGRTLVSEQPRRHNAHSTSEEDTVFRYAKENGLAVPPMEIIEENITPIEGLEREDIWVKYYKEKGYNVLNKAKTGVGSGSLGAMNFGKWTKEAVFEKANEYNTRSEFAKGCSSAYDAARRNGWLKEIFWFKEGKKPNNYWNNWERVFEEAKKYSTREDFKKGCQTAYHAAWRNGWLDKLFPKCEKSKAVLQIDLITNEVIAEFPSISEVERQFGFRNISSCCLGKRKTAYNFIWRYKENVA